MTAQCTFCKPGRETTCVRQCQPPGFVVQCENCGAVGCIRPTEKDAIESWDFINSDSDPEGRVQRQWLELEVSALSGDKMARETIERLAELLPKS